MYKRNKFKTKRSKYGVDISSKGKKDRTFDGYEFDSLLEMRFYRDYLLPRKKTGEIKEIILQPVFLLQKSFTKNNVNYRKTEYIGDFKVVYKNNEVEIFDTKGLPDATSKLKKKWFDFTYPDIKLTWIVYRKDVGYIQYEELEKMKRKEKKERAKLI